MLVQMVQIVLIEGVLIDEKITIRRNLIAN